MTFERATDCENANRADEYQKSARLLSYLSIYFILEFCLTRWQMILNLLLLYVLYFVIVVRDYDG